MIFAGTALPAAMLMLAQGAAPAAQAAEARAPIIDASARVSVTVLRAARISAQDPAEAQRRGARITRDDAGTVWIEFS